MANSCGNLERTSSGAASPPCDHLVEIYTDDTAFLDSLGGFVTAGLRSGEAVIVIADPAHRYSLEFRLRAAGLDVKELLRQDHYIPLDASGTLSQFMIDVWPDEQRFKQVFSGILTRARRGGRRVRAFGEMVALLWAEGHHRATIRLEHLWAQYCQKETFPLFCAYPRSGFTSNADAAIREICSAHSRMVSLTPPHLVDSCPEPALA